MKDVNIGAVDTGYSYKWRIPGQGRQEDENTVTVAKRDGRGGGGRKEPHHWRPLLRPSGSGGGGGKLHLTRNGKHLTQKVNVQATSIDVNQWQKSGFRLAKRSAKISASESRSSTRRFIYFLFILQPKRGK